MDRLNWDETDFIEITEVIPEVEEYETQHSFFFDRKTKKVSMLLWQLESFVEITVSELETNIDVVKLAFYCRGKCEVNNKDEVIVFHDSVFAENMYSYLDKGNIYEKDARPYGNDVRLFISKERVFLDIV
jgi:hypothetical protein